MFKTKICSKCGEEKPATTEYFGLNKDSKDGLYSRCKDCTKIEGKKYREQHRKELSEKQRKYMETHKEVRQSWRLKNKEKIKLYQKQYNNLNRKHISAQSKKYKTEHKDKLSRQEKEYRQLNKEKVKLWNNNRRVRINKGIVNITEKDWQECLKFFDYKDAYTGLPMEIISMDHVVPVSKDGLMVRQNLVPCEKSINSSKGNKCMEEWYRQQPFYSNERLKRIYQWIGIKENIQQLSII